MVRLSSIMTLACTTIIVAGSTASAADKAVGPQPEAKNSVANAPMSLRARVTNWTTSPSVFGAEEPGCDCLWFNGDWDERDAQASHEGGAFPQGVKAADDFYLCEGFVYDLESISGYLCTDSLEQLTKARLELYSDCNGRPDELLYTFKVFEKNETGIVVDGYRLVQFVFNVEDQIDDDLSDNENACNSNIVLKGGTYWVSLIGLSDNRCITMPNMCDSSFFATANGGVIRGSVAHKIEGEDTGHWNEFSYSSGTWEALDECCIGCTDLAFTVCATPCKILIDNGVNDTDDADGRRVGSHSQRSTSGTRNSRSADDFVVNPCSDFNVCYIEGCVYTNCVGFIGWFDILGNSCKRPSYILGGSTIESGRSTCIVDLGYDVTIDGRPGLVAYRVEFHDLDFTLDAGNQYWISISVQDTFSQNERAYFCYNADCDRTCLIRFNPGHRIGEGATQWTSVDRDFSFLIAGDDADRNGSGSTPACTADFNRDGTATVQDLFDFLSSWFAGCP
jgi:hypothetical protein